MRPKTRVALAVATLGAAVAVGVACGGRGPVSDRDAGQAAITVDVAVAEQVTVGGVLRVTGTLVAGEGADVAAETAGRVVATGVERGSRVRAGDMLVTLLSTEAAALAAEAVANVGQLEARLGLTSDAAFDVELVPEVASARASRDLAEADFARIRHLLDQRVVSQAEYDLRRTQAEAARNQYDTARNAVRQLHRQLEAARARAALARKALGDTIVRAPFAGQVVSRAVGVGDFVTRGTKVAALVRITPLRVELTVPEQSIRHLTAGQQVHLAVDAYPGREFDARVRHIAPALLASQRALVVEAVAANDDGALKPGMFATARIDLPATEPAVVVPAAAVGAAAGVSHVFVVHGDRVERRLVTPGARLGDRVQILKGLVPGEPVVVGPPGTLTDGARVAPAGPTGAALTRSK